MKNLHYTIARTPFGSAFFGWVVRYMNFLNPGGNLIETETLIAFNHPSPSYPIHILIVPKKKIYITHANRFRRYGTYAGFDY
jgi:hypothetical protein